MDTWCPDCLGYFSFLLSMPFPLQGIAASTRSLSFVPSLLKRGISRILSRMQQKRRRQRKWKLNSGYLKLYRAYPVSFNSTNVGKCFRSLILKPVSKFKKRKEKVVFLCSLSSKKREIRHSHVVVVQRGQRNVQKSVMHVQSFCFANPRAWSWRWGNPLSVH